MGERIYHFNNMERKRYPISDAYSHDFDNLL